MKKTILPINKQWVVVGGIFVGPEEMYYGNVIRNKYHTERLVSKETLEKMKSLALVETSDEIIGGSADEYEFKSHIFHDSFEEQDPSDLFGEPIRHVSYKEIKNYIHNDMKISRKDIDFTIERIVEQRVEKKIGEQTNLIESAIHKSVRDIIVAGVEERGHMFNDFKTRVTQMVSKEVSNQIRDVLDIKVSIKEETPETQEVEDFIANPFQGIVRIGSEVSSLIIDEAIPYEQGYIFKAHGKNLGSITVMYTMRGAYDAIQRGVAIATDRLKIGKFSYTTDTLVYVRDVNGIKEIVYKVK